MHRISCTNTHHDFTDLVNYEMVENTKTWISWERNITFPQNKKILNMCLKYDILRNYWFVVDIILKFSSTGDKWGKNFTAKSEFHIA